MDAIKAIKERRSIRAYKDKAIPKDMLEQLVDAGRLAPTARNIQPWEFIVVTEAELLKKIAGITDHGKFIRDSKACIVVFCSDTKYYLEDGCAATENIMLAAAAAGIGSCWVAGDKKEYCRQINELLFVPLSYRLVSIIPLGYPAAEKISSPDKRGLKELIHWERF